MGAGNAIVSKSKVFALRVINMYQFLVNDKREYVLSRQVLRSGTSIGANVRESQRAQSRADFVSKLEIALKEADETQYWLELLHESGYLNPDAFESMNHDCEELIRLLVSITAAAKQSPPPHKPVKFRILNSEFRIKPNNSEF